MKGWLAKFRILVFPLPRRPGAQRATGERFFRCGWGLLCFLIKCEGGRSQGVERESGTGCRGQGSLVRRVGLEDGSEKRKPGGHQGFHP